MTAGRGSLSARSALLARPLAHPVRLPGTRTGRLAGALAATLALGACGDAIEPTAPPERSPAEIPFRWELPEGFPTPIVPDDNPMSFAKVELGRRLFFDRRLSENGTRSCADCHQPARAFTDGRPHAVGSTGEPHPRGAQPLANVAYLATLTWASPTLVRLEAQAVIPIFGADPVELGFGGRERELEARLAEDAALVAAFAEAFPDADVAVSSAHVVRALAAFQRTLISGDAPVDRFRRGDDDALSPSARRGLALFESERLACASCHAGFAYTDAAFDPSAEGEIELLFHNTGLYDVDGEGGYPATNQGLFTVTGRPEDMGRFRTPSLRNVAVTAPYLHDGSAPTLEDVLDHYARGGRRIAEGPDAGDGRESPLKDPRIRGFSLSAGEREDLLAFLREGLTDEAFLTRRWAPDPG